VLSAAFRRLACAKLESGAVVGGFSVRGGYRCLGAVVLLFVVSLIRDLESNKTNLCFSLSASLMPVSCADFPV
jgi:hypothetical protein